MPITIVSLLIFVFAILPGIPGENIFSQFMPSNWRHKDWQVIARTLMFSVLGFVFYLLLSNLIDLLPYPLYVVPSTFTSEEFSFSEILPMAIAYIFHFLSAIVMGFMFGYLAQCVAKVSPTAIYKVSWDIFVRKHVQSHWVIVSLNNGSAYAGILACAEVSVVESERDIVICEPAVYDTVSKNYRSLPYMSLYLPASLVSSVAVYHNEEDERITEIGENIFSDKDENE